MNANDIALTVEEPAPGQFFWVLQAQRVRAAIARAARPMPSYGLAVMAGTSELAQRSGAADSRCRQRVLERASDDFGPTTISGTL